MNKPSLLFFATSTAAFTSCAITSAYAAWQMYAASEQGFCGAFIIACGLFVYLSVLSWRNARNSARGKGVRYWLTLWREVLFIRIARMILFGRDVERSRFISRPDNKALWAAGETIESIERRILNGYED
jgi:hypothetical protein